MHSQAFFSDRLHARISALNSRACVGLDPDLALFPQVLLRQFSLRDSVFGDFSLVDREAAAQCIVAFNKAVIDCVCSEAAAVKPQSAHYERYGPHGLAALEETARYARSKGLVVILDAKKNDIGSTAAKYALAYLGYDHNDCAIPVDALTVNAYLGSDGIIPFVKACKENGAGLFILVKTSNPSSAEFQDLRLADGRSLCQAVAEMVDTWGAGAMSPGGYSSVGAVIGATHPEDIRRLRKIMPRTVFLVPGYGAQGAPAENIAPAFDKDGLGAIVNSSRGVIYSFDPADSAYQDRILQSARHMKEDLNRCLGA